MQANSLEPDIVQDTHEHEVADSDGWGACHVYTSYMKQRVWRSMHSTFEFSHQNFKYRLFSRVLCT